MKSFDVDLNVLVFQFVLHLSAVGLSAGQFVALILARGGSKQIPRKNLAVIESKSLLKRTISVAESADVFEEIWVSTDDLEIYAEAVSAGAKVYARSEETSSDIASSLDAVLEFYSFFPNFTAMALLQCTSPFHSPTYLRKARFMIDKLGYDSVFSTTQNSKLLWRKNERGDMVPVNFDVTFRPRRQDMEWQWLENGMFYWFRSNLLEQGVLQGGNIGMVEIPLDRSLEIDSFDDLEYARYIAPKVFPVLQWEEMSCVQEEN